MIDPPNLLAVTTQHAPPPAGTYSQAIKAAGLIFLAGQVPKTPDGRALRDAPFEEQVNQAIDNLEAVAAAAGASLRVAVKVNVYLRDAGRMPEFDRIYRERVGDPPPARTTTQSDLPAGVVEIDAVLIDPNYAKSE